MTAFSNTPDPAPAPAAATADWEQIHQQVGEFAVAKSVVEFFDANPQYLNLHPTLYLRAKIALKREQIEYARRQQLAPSPRRSSLLGSLGAMRSSMQLALQSPAAVALLAVVLVFTALR